MHSRVLVDEYRVSGSEKLRVDGRYGHETSTEMDIARTVRLEVRKPAAVAAMFIPGFDLPSEEKFDPNQDFENAHLTAPLALDTRPYALNKGIEKLQYKPVGADNYYECDPPTQATLLPYLISSRSEENNRFQNATDHQTAVVDNPIVPPYFNFRAFDGYCLTTFTGSEVRANAETMVNNSFVPSDRLEIVGAVDGRLPVTVAGNTISLPQFRVRIGGEIFGQAANANFYVFDVPAQAFGPTAFDEFGRAVPRAAATDYELPVATHREFLPIQIPH